MGYSPRGRKESKPTEQLSTRMCPVKSDSSGIVDSVI